jgi:hypothetical protein
MVEHIPSTECNCQTVSDDYSDHRQSCPLWITGRKASLPKRLRRANDRCRAAAQRLDEANDELAAAEIEWRLANEALEEVEAIK